MKELLVNQINVAVFDIFVQGAPTNATGAVTVSLIKDARTLIADASTTTSETGIYQYYVPVSVVAGDEVIPVTSEECFIDVVWKFTVEQSNFVVTDKYHVSTPYASWSDFRDPSVTDPAEQKEKYADFLEAERVSRKIIDDYCGQSFGMESTTYAVEGAGQDGLNMPRRLLALTELTWSTAQASPGQTINTTGRVWEIIADGWQIRKPTPRRFDLFEPGVRFKRNTTYTVKGLWGWDSVPVAVIEAAKILTADYLCSDHKYRDRYLEMVKSSDWNIKYSNGAWDGTGNATADDLLNDYRLSPGFGVI